MAKRQTKTSAKKSLSANEGEGEKSPRIVRRRVDSLALFEVTEAELEKLEAGSPNSLQLNFGIALVSVALSFTASHLASPPPDVYVFSVFVCVQLVGYALGAILLIIWYRNKSEVGEILKRIRSRPDDASFEAGDSDDEQSERDVPATAPSPGERSSENGSQA